MGIMTFEDQLADRTAGAYADFLLPHLSKESHLLDCGCGDGALAMSLATVCGRVTALDVSSADFQAAADASRGLHELTFVQGDATLLPFRDGTFDAVLGHSVLESGIEPSRFLAEALRALRPGGLLGVASVEYGGLILAGPDVELLRRSNQIREQTWRRSGADPFLGRELRRLVCEAGFVDVEATTKAFSYGTPALVSTFARGRASECSDAEYVTAAVEAGLTTEEELAEMAAAWSRWGDSQAAYAAFTWCRAVARRPRH
jgi:ubiquinone/menaquinone biosynthesis C-methylase UbiE